MAHIFPLMFSCMLILWGIENYLVSFDILIDVAEEMNATSESNHQVMLCGLGKSALKNLSRPMVNPCLTAQFKERFYENYGISIGEICEEVESKGWQVDLYQQGRTRRDDNWYFHVMKRKKEESI